MNPTDWNWSLILTLFALAIALFFGWRAEQSSHALQEESRRVRALTNMLISYLEITSPSEHVQIKRAPSTGEPQSLAVLLSGTARAESRATGSAIPSHFPAMHKRMPASIQVTFDRLLNGEHVSAFAETALYDWFKQDRKKVRP